MTENFAVARIGDGNHGMGCQIVRVGGNWVLMKLKVGVEALACQKVNRLNVMVGDPMEMALIGRTRLVGM